MGVPYPFDVTVYVLLKQQTPGHRWQAHLQLLVMIWRQCCAKRAIPRKAWAAWEWLRLCAQPPAAPQQILHGTLPALIVHIMRVLSDSMTGLFRSVESQVTRCFNSYHAISLSG